MVWGEFPKTFQLLAKLSPAQTLRKQGVHAFVLAVLYMYKTIETADMHTRTAQISFESRYMLKELEWKAAAAAAAGDVPEDAKG